MGLFNRHVSLLLSLVASSFVSVSAWAQTQTPATQIAKKSTESAQTRVTVLQLGLAHALERSAIGPGSTLHVAIQGLIERISQGSSFDEAVQRSGLRAGTVQRLLEIGRGSHIASQVASTKVTPSAKMPLRVPSSLGNTQQQDQVLTIQLRQTLKARVNQKLAQEISKADAIDTVGIQLSPQQQQFLASLNDLGEQQQRFLAKLSEDRRELPQSESIVVNPKPTATQALEKNSKQEQLLGKTPITAVQPSEGSTLSAAPNPTAPRVRPNQYEVANALVAGLAMGHRNGQVRYGSWMYYKVQSVIKMIRKGKPIPEAIQVAQVPPAVASQLLQWGGLNPNAVGI